MLNIEVRGLRNTIQTLLDAEKEFDNLEEFFRGPATRTMKRVFADIFRNEGATRRTEAWRPREGHRGRRRWGANRLLQDTGRLRRSYVSSPVVQVSPRTMRIGSNVPYARYHEHGTSRIPARPVVGYAAVIAPSRLQRALTKYFREKIDGNS